jgi:hypothetical protein
MYFKPPTSFDLVTYHTIPVFEAKLAKKISPAQNHILFNIPW